MAYNVPNVDVVRNETDDEESIPLETSGVKGKGRVPKIEANSDTTGTEEDASDTDDEIELGEPSAEGPEKNGTGETIEYRVEALIKEHAMELEEQIKTLERDLEDLDNFARISLSERRIQKSEEGISVLSDSLTGFAERNFDKLNQLEERMTVQTMLLSAILKALEDEDVTIDISETKRFQDDNVLESAPEKQLNEIVDDLSS